MTLRREAWLPHLCPGDVVCAICRWERGRLGWAALTPRYRFLTQHDYACRVVECRRPIVWIDRSILGVGLGWCAVHRPRRGVYVPITIYGEEGASWWQWPPRAFSR